MWQRVSKGQSLCHIDEKILFFTSVNIRKNVVINLHLVNENGENSP
jgi:hypothetical protein